MVSLTLNVCEERLTQPVEPTTLQGDALASAAMSVRESVNTFIAVSRLSVEEK